MRTNTKAIEEQIEIMQRALNTMKREIQKQKQIFYVDENRKIFKCTLYHNRTFRFIPRDWAHCSTCDNKKCKYRETAI